MKDNKSGWQFPKALEIIKCKEGNKEFMKERPARRPFGNTVLICEYPIDDTAAEEPRSMADMLTKAPTRFSAVDCPVCGRQIALAIRAPRIDFPAIVERRDADAEETEGGEDED